MSRPALSLVVLIAADAACELARALLRVADRATRAPAPPPRRAIGG